MSVNYGDDTLPGTGYSVRYGVFDTALLRGSRGQGPRYPRLGIISQSHKFNIVSPGKTFKHQSAGSADPSCIDFLPPVPVKPKELTRYLGTSGGLPQLGRDLNRRVSQGESG